MKKNLIALAVLAAASGAAFAQSSVSIYGIADVWFGSAESDNLTQTVIQSGGVSSSRIGFKGTEDLGGGLKANFVLEQGFNLDTGSTVAGQAFSRQSYVGFSGGFGEVRVGKTYSPFDDIAGATNAAFDSALSPNVGVWASSEYQANPANSIYYATPSFSGFSGALSYSLGENKDTPVVGVDAGNVTSMNVKYQGGPVYAGFAYQSEKATDASVATKFTRLNGSYDLGVVKLLAGYGRAENVLFANSDTTDWQVGVDYPVSPALTVSAGYAHSSDDDTVFMKDSKRSGFGLAAAYSLSKRTTVYAGLRATTAEEAGSPDFDSNVYAVGVKHTF